MYSVAVILCCVVAACAYSGPCTVSTRLGKIQGIPTQTGSAFLGVPYAEPPVGDLRWKPTQIVNSSWDDTLYADTFGYTCPQLPSPFLTVSYPNQSEDCLTLNIWTPMSGICAESNSAKEASLPVMVFVQGGGFVVGSSSDPIYDGAQLSATENVIVITFNYRLGALGFLALPQLQAEDPHNSTGNYGFYDQIAVLQWVKDNIVQFGGDPNQVLLFGESAGGNSVLAHLVSSLSAGLFSSALSESGFYRGIYELEVATVGGEFFLQNTGCDEANDIPECLRQVPVNQILATQAPCLWLPTIDGYVLTGYPNDQVDAGYFNKVPVVIGANQDEGTLLAASLYGINESAIPLVLMAFFPPQYVPSIMKMYPLSNYPSTYYQIAAILGDWNIKCSSRRFAGVLAAQNISSYLYQFSYPPRNNGYYYNTSIFMGAYHAAEVPYIFHTEAFDAAEEHLSADIMSYWASTAQYGDPNGNGEFPDVVWPTYNSSTDLNIDLNLINSVQQGLDIQQLCDFWDTLPEYTQAPSPQCSPSNM